MKYKSKQVKRYNLGGSIGTAAGGALALIPGVGPIVSAIATPLLNELGTSIYDKQTAKPEVAEAIMPVDPNSSTAIKNFRYGGGVKLKTITGPKHEKGGVPLKDKNKKVIGEVEGGETKLVKDGNPEFIFSDSIEATDKETFADVSKKMSDSPEDLKKLANLQEVMKGKTKVYKRGGLVTQDPPTKYQKESLSDRMARENPEWAAQEKAAFALKNAAKMKILREAAVREGGNKKIEYEAAMEANRAKATKAWDKMKSDQENKAAAAEYARLESLRGLGRLMLGAKDVTNYDKSQTYQGQGYSTQTMIEKAAENAKEIDAAFKKQIEPKKKNTYDGQSPQRQAEAAKKEQPRRENEIAAKKVVKGVDTKLDGMVNLPGRINDNPKMVNLPGDAKKPLPKPKPYKRGGPIMYDKGGKLLDAAAIAAPLLSAAIGTQAFKTPKLETNAGFNTARAMMPTKFSLDGARVASRQSELNTSNALSRMSGSRQGLRAAVVSNRAKSLDDQSSIEMKEQLGQLDLDQKRANLEIDAGADVQNINNTNATNTTQARNMKVATAAQAITGVQDAAVGIRKDRYNEKMDMLRLAMQGATSRTAPDPDLFGKENFIEFFGQEAYDKAKKDKAGAVPVSPLNTRTVSPLDYTRPTFQSYKRNK